MQKAVPSARSAPSFWMKVVAALLLVCHVASATAIVPFAVLTLAAVDGSHSIIVEYNGSSAGVRLHHRAEDFTPSSCDHHSLAGRLAATLCGAAKTDGDHVLATSSASLNTEVKKREDLATSTRLISSDFCLAASLEARVRELFRGASCEALATKCDARFHGLHAHHHALSTVILLV